LEPLPLALRLQPVPGEDAASEIIQATTDALATRSDWDAVIFIRGVGAVIDLAWRNDYALGR
jgi:exonuclease VII large subunit